ncbi:MAG: hypothetical protein GKR86_00220 [Ilumatobacter sp.]|nr:hypothetical protein [Ilumatobacter sp.]
MDAQERINETRDRAHAAELSAKVVEERLIAHEKQTKLSFDSLNERFDKFENKFIPMMEKLVENDVRLSTHIRWIMGIGASVLAIAASTAIKYFFF